jgi:hypothetical protein
MGLARFDSSGDADLVHSHYHPRNTFCPACIDCRIQPLVVGATEGVIIVPNVGEVQVGGYQNETSNWAGWRIVIVELLPIPTALNVGGGHAQLVRQASGKIVNQAILR